MSGGGVSWPTDYGTGGTASSGSQQALTDLIPDEKRSQYEVEINDHLEDFIREFSQRDTDTIGTHLQTLRQALERDADLSIELRYGGSVKKHTYVDGLSDVDAVALVKGSDLEDRTPKQVIHDFANRIRDRLPYTELKEGEMAATVRFADGYEIQVLPAIKTANGMRVAAQTGEKWSSVTNPDRFASRLTAVNQQTSGKVVRVIRLFKAVVNPRLNDYKLSGYHVEALAVDAFANYAGRTTNKDMLLHLTQHASEAVLSPLSDATGQSIHVDDDLGATNSAARKMTASALQREFSKMKDADTKASVKRWTELMDS